MSNSATFLSIKSLFVWVVMAITTLALIVSSGILLINQISAYKAEITNDVEIFSELIGLSAIPHLLANSSIKEEKHLQMMSVADFIDNIHIYKVNENNEKAFFASYNKPGHIAVQAMYTRIDDLKSAKLTGDVIEVIKPIISKDELIGYTYLRASAQNLNKMVINSVVVTTIVLIVTVTICFLLTLRLQSSVTQPIGKLVTLVQNITRQKDYSVRAEESSIRELDILADAFNAMLQRIQEHMARQAQAEEEHRRLHSSLEDKVSQRTAALKEANQELIQTLEKLHQFQRQMVQNEKMASLGDMVAGVAHEVNTPIGLGVTASTMMLDRLNELQKEFNGKTLKASTLSRFIEEGQENLSIIYRNLDRAAELISSFKQVAVDQSSESNRMFAFSKLMDEILLSMRPKLKKYPHEIKVHCPENLYIESKAGPINQIMINLIMNSFIHGFEFMELGEVDIYIDIIDNSKINIIYKDNGRGIPEHLRKRIFDPFVTTKRGQGGSGLGMHLVYNLVTQALNGSISINSKEDEGVEFQIMFPVRKVDSNQVSRQSK